MKTNRKTGVVLMAAAALFLTSCGGGGSNINPDSKMSEVAGEMAGMKTYMIEYKSTLSSNEINSVTKTVQWVDTENDRYAFFSESESNYMGEKQTDNSLMIMKDGYSYIINLKDKTGFKTKDGELEEDPTADIMPEDDVTFRQMIEAEGGKILGNEKFLGRDCIVVELNQADDSGEPLLTKMWYYKGIMLKMQNSFTTMEAVKFEENARIPAEKFEVPAGIQLMEMPGMP
ncbi:MAG: hypothetical protein VB072_05515 [Lentimicrobium sp.]|jgi:outer membrane lipoprotein-sorting protein|nr:hypothetical protein [Lentimicrobium sp.]MEA5109868.1 hypothetical protein [Lentimicrobium sp.]